MAVTPVAWWLGVAVAAAVAFHGLGSALFAPRRRPRSGSLEVAAGCAALATLSGFAVVGVAVLALGAVHAVGAALAGAPDEPDASDESPAARLRRLPRPRVVGALAAAVVLLAGSVVALAAGGVFHSRATWQLHSSRAVGSALLHGGAPALVAVGLVVVLVSAAVADR